MIKTLYSNTCSDVKQKYVVNFKNICERKQTSISACKNYCNFIPNLISPMMACFMSDIWTGVNNSTFRKVSRGKLGRKKSLSGDVCPVASRVFMEGFKLRILLLKLIGFCIFHFLVVNFFYVKVYLIIHTSWRIKLGSCLIKANNFSIS